MPRCERHPPRLHRSAAASVLALFVAACFADDRVPARSVTPAPARAETAAAAEAGGCEIPYSGPVAVIPVRNAHALSKAMDERGAVAIVYETADTTVYEDGSVLTTRVEAVGEHLSLLGWASNPMRILGASAPRTAMTLAATEPGKRTRRRG